MQSHHVHHQGTDLTFSTATALAKNLAREPDAGSPYHLLHFDAGGFRYTQSPGLYTGGRMDGQPLLTNTPDVQATLVSHHGRF